MTQAAVEELLNRPADRVCRPPRRQPRRVDGLEWAQWAEKGPRRARKAKNYTPVQQRGIAFERKVKRPLRRRWPKARILSGPWIEFWDASGHGFAQPDYLVEAEGFIWIVECKLSHVAEARIQLVELYSPLISYLCPGWRQARLEVAKYPNSTIPPIPIDSLDQVKETHAAQETYLWYFLG